MPEPSDQANILLITTDQHHYSALGFNNEKIRTPRLDSLAAEGTTFSRAYCPNPVCTPTRASILTGLYPSAHGAWTIGVKLAEDVPTVSQALSNAGYYTALIGKAHFQPLASRPDSESVECHPTVRDLGFWRGFHGPWYGFEHVEVARNHTDESWVGQHYALWLEERGLADWEDYFRAAPGSTRGSSAPRQYHWDLPAGLHYTTWTAERTIAQLDRAAAEGRPFFCWASFQDPHPSYLTSEPWASMYNPEDMEPGKLVPDEHDANPPYFQLTQQPSPDFSRWREDFGAYGFYSHLRSQADLQRDMAVYYGMVSFVDDQVGRILAHLDELCLAQNTMVVFTADHGHFLGQHGLIQKGAFHYEDLLRVPLIVRLPERIPAGGRSPAIQSLVDLAPTFLALAGLNVPGQMQGLNQLEAWEGGSSARKWAVVENRHQPTKLNLRTLVTPRHKITLYHDADYGQLFDLESDPGEVRNLWSDPDARSLKERLLLAMCQIEMSREPTRMPRISTA